MDRLLQLAGDWLAGAYALYGLGLLLVPAFLCIGLVLLGAVVWAAIAHERGRRPWPAVPGSVRCWVLVGAALACVLLYAAKDA